MRTWIRIRSHYGLGLFGFFCKTKYCMFIIYIWLTLWFRLLYVEKNVICAFNHRKVSVPVWKKLSEAKSEHPRVECLSTSYINSRLASDISNKKGGLISQIFLLVVKFWRKTSKSVSRTQRGFSFHLFCPFNPFLANGPILYSLKIPENLWFFGVFRGYEMETFDRNELI